MITSPAEDHTYSIVPTFGAKEETADNRCPTPESEKSAPDAAYEFETCGTDLETDDNLSIGSLDEDECDLADSGFHGLKKRGSSTNQRKRRATRSLSPAPKKGKRARTSPRNSSKPTPVKRGLKVRFQKKGKSSAAQKNPRKRKITPQDGDGTFTSDADSGKDSPKVVRKTRKRTAAAPAKKSVTIPKQAKKNSNATKSAVNNRATPYGTRSSSRKTRQSTRDRMGSVLERAAARKMRQHSVSADSEDEEIKLAAGSLLHLAGFRASG